MKTTYVDRPEVNEAYADAVKRVTFHEGAVYIELVVTRMDEIAPKQEQTATQYTSVRVTLPPPAAMQLSENIRGLFGVLEENGIVKRMDTPQPPSPAAH